MAVWCMDISSSQNQKKKKKNAPNEYLTFAEILLIFTLPYGVWPSIVIVHEKSVYFCFFSKYLKNG